MHTVDREGGWRDQTLVDKLGTFPSRTRMISTAIGSYYYGDDDIGDFGGLNDFDF